MEQNLILFVHALNFSVFSTNAFQIYTAEGEQNYKSPRMKELDEEIGDIKMQIIDTETSSVLRYI